MSEQDAGAALAGADATPAPSIEDTMGAAFDRVETQNGADRADNGKFTPHDKPAGAGTGDADKKSPDASAVGQQGAAQPLTPPSSWSDADQALFAKAPPDVQKVILDTEAKRTEGVNRKLEEVATERKRYESLNPVLAPIEAEARKYGMTADAAVKQMFDRHVDLQTRGADALKDLAKLYGIKLDGPTGSTSHDGGDVDPEIAALKSELATLKSELGGFKNHQVTAQRTQVERDMDAVRDEKGPDSKPLRPHFEALYDDMAPIAADLRTKNPGWPLSKVFSEAYDRAVHANPETRAKVIAEQRAKEKAEEERLAKERAKGALRSAGNNTRQIGAHAGGGSQKSKSIEETMGRAYDEATAA